jgi:hypothetical protein
LRLFKYILLLLYPIWLTIIVIVIADSFNGRFEIDRLIGFFPYLLLLSSPATIPSIYLLINHLSKGSSKTKFEVKNGNIVLQTKNGLEEIKDLKMIKRDPKKDKYLDLLPWSSFFYLQGKSSDGIVNISCLHIDSKDVQFDKTDFSNFPLIK